jgi:arylsulfatase A-like enzyme/cytochrome c-type biogenesis protein CcmH/NrfG
VKGYALLFFCVFSSPAALANDDPPVRAIPHGCYGYRSIETPGVDQLANDGVRFAQAFTPSPITNSSHASILTGLLPSSHGVSDFGVPLAAAHATLAELLRKQGYQTAAFIGAVILDSKTLAPGLDRGFDFYDNFPEKTDNKSRWGRIERRGMDVVQHAENWIDAHKTVSHFVWIHLYDPHDPYEPPAPYDEKYKDRPYDGEVAYADSALSYFLAYLKKQSWYDGALIIVVGDHGEGLGQHGENTHGIFLYDSTTHVPLILKLPEEKDAGKVIGELVRTVDVMPTVLDLLKFPAVAKLDGTSLLPTISGAERIARTIFGETDYPVHFGWAPLRSIRQDGFKFIEAPRPELYDLEADPGETRNRYVPWDSTTQTLRKVLTEKRSKTPSPTSPATVSAGTVSELRALGYLDASDARSSTDVPEPSLLPDPKDKIGVQNLLHTAMMAAEEGRSMEARMALKKVLALDDTYPVALRQLGQLEIDSGNYKEAVPYLKRLCESHPNDAGAALDYGRALRLSGDFEGAHRALAKSLSLDRNQSAARLLLGQIALQSAQYKTAEDEFASALLAKPADEEAQIGLAKALLGQKKFTDAAELLETSVASGTQNVEFFDLLEQAYRALGKPGDAKKARERARSLRPTS